MLQTILIAFTTFFATVSPLDMAALLAAVSPNSSPGQRRSMAFRATIVAAAILLSFALLGTRLLDYLGISLAALRIAGGILLLLLSINMVFGKHSEIARPGAADGGTAGSGQDISVFPLAMPFIAGPGTISATVLLMAEARGDWLSQALVLGALLAVLLISLAVMLSISQFQRLLGQAGLQIISRVVGLLLTALSVQFILDGFAEAGILA